MKKLYLQVAERLELEIGALPAGSLLDSQANLCIRFNVSRPVITRAVAHLEQKGLLDVAAGRRARVPDSARNVTCRETVQSGAIQLEKHLVNGITTGIYQPGNPFPKYRWFTDRFGICDKTVGKVFMRLSNRELVHRVGNRWVPGTRGPVDSTPSSRFIAIMAQSKNHWASICRADRTYLFGSSFLTEANRVGIRIVHTSCPSQSEFEQTIDRLSDSKTGYMGAFLALAAERIRILTPQIYKLLSLGRPVFWLDRSDSGCPIDHPYFARLRISEHSAVWAALTHIHQYDHKSVLYVDYSWTPWSDRRFRLLQDLAARKYPEIVVHGTREKPPHGVNWYQDVTNFLVSQNHRKTELISLLSDYLRNCSYELEYHGNAVQTSTGIAQNHQALLRISEALFRMQYPDIHHWRIGRLLALSLLLPPCINRLSPTALIVPNDSVGRDVHEWASLAGFRIPEDLGILSFDNSLSRVPLTLSSVDFGFGYLGYSAFHAILGDLPIWRPGKKRITARAGVAQYGSFEPLPWSGACP